MATVIETEKVVAVDLLSTGQKLVCSRPARNLRFSIEVRPKESTLCWCYINFDSRTVALL